MAERSSAYTIGNDSRAICKICVKLFGQSGTNPQLAQWISAGFYGLDIYSLHASMALVLAYLDKVDPDAARRARSRYACFDQFGDDPQTYGYAAGLGLRPTCETEVITQLIDLQRNAMRYARMDGVPALERYFDAERNARVVKDAEEYYRTMFQGRVSSWNLRDRHMVETHRPACPRKKRQRLPAHRLHHLFGDSHSSIRLGRSRGTEVGEDGQTRQLRRAPPRSWHTGIHAHAQTWQPCGGRAARAYARTCDWRCVLAAI